MKNDFTVTNLTLPGVLLITPQIRADHRGFSSKVYHPASFKTIGITVPFTEDFTSFSKKDVLRGLHFQRAPHMQDKLVRVSRGEIFDVAADCDPGSPTYGQHISTLLNEIDQTMLYIPGKYAHGFCVLSNDATLEYKLSDTYYAEFAGGVRFDDPVLAIPWPVTFPILSDADKVWPPLN